MRKSRKLLRAICVLSFAGGCTLFILGLQIALSLNLHLKSLIIALLGILIIGLSILGFIGAGKERSGMLMTYFFASFFAITCLFIVVYTAFCFQNSLESWIKHNWNRPVLSILREESCCGSYESTVAYLEAQFMALGLVGGGCIVLQVAAIACVIVVVTLPIIMRHLLAVLNFVFVLLGVSAFIYGYTISSMDDVTTQQRWIAMIFVIAGTFIVGLSGLGIIGARAKSRSVLLVYILGITICLIAFLTCTVAAFTLQQTEAISSSQLACELQLSGCTNCTIADREPCPGIYWEEENKIWKNCSTEKPQRGCELGMIVLNDPKDQGFKENDVGTCGECPQWSHRDIETYLNSSLRLLGVAASIVCLFTVVGLVGAIILRKSLAGYQTDSI